jgi:hypothetical protein
MALRQICRHGSLLPRSTDVLITETPDTLPLCYSLTSIEHFKIIRIDGLLFALIITAHMAQNTLTAGHQNAQASIAEYKGKDVELGKEAQVEIHTLSSGVVAELEKIQVGPPIDVV